jgi:UDP-GlcNAc:undecaprenyl-phosphate GlcNAc-1-phosphate transferase
MTVAPPLAALGLAAIFCLVLTPAARRCGWVDKPDWRKQHAGNVPLVGGPAIFLAVLAVLAWRGGWSPSVHVLAWSSAIVFLAGLVDDRVSMKVPLRFALQISALLCMVWAGHVQLYNFGFLFWQGWLGLGPLAVPITLFSALGVINAFNMIDGLDGLAGTLALIALGGLAFLAGRGGFAEEHALLLIVCGAVLGFLLLNFRFPWRQRARVFLGDSGSSWLGFVMAWLFIALSQQAPDEGLRRAYAPITAVWMFGLPLMDTTYVMIRRARQGDPIFAADRRHLHHLFLRTGHSVLATWAIMAGGALALALVGICAELRGWPQWGMFYLYVLLCLGYFFWMERVWRARRFLGRVVA